MKKSVSGTQVSVPESSPSEEDGQSMPHSPALQSSGTLRRTKSTLKGLNMVESTDARTSSQRFTPMSGQKGIMEIFRESRGKFACNSTLTSPSSSSAEIPKIQVPSVTDKPIEEVDNSQAAMNVKPIKDQKAQPRGGWKSGREIIGKDLREFKTRKDELRVEGAQRLAKSQPNLLSTFKKPSVKADDDLQIPSLFSVQTFPNLWELDTETCLKKNDSSEDQGAMHVEPVEEEIAQPRRSLKLARKKTEKGTRKMKIIEDESSYEGAQRLAKSEPNLSSIHNETGQNLLNPYNDEDLPSLCCVHTFPDDWELEIDKFIKELDFPEDQGAMHVEPVEEEIAQPRRSLKLARKKTEKGQRKMKIIEVESSYEVQSGFSQRLAKSKPNLPSTYKETKRNLSKNNDDDKKPFFYIPQ